MDHNPLCSTQRDLTLPCARRLRAEAARRWLGQPSPMSWIDRAMAIAPPDEEPVDEEPAVPASTAEATA